MAEMASNDPMCDHIPTTVTAEVASVIVEPAAIPETAVLARIADLACPWLCIEISQVTSSYFP